MPGCKKPKASWLTPAGRSSFCGLSWTHPESHHQQPLYKPLRKASFGICRMMGDAEWTVHKNEQGEEDEKEEEEDKG